MDSAQLLSVAVGALFRRKLAAMFAFMLTIVVVLVGIALTPRIYRSEARLFVRLGRETVTLDPTATTGQTVAVQSSREIEVRSVRDMLASRILLEKVVDKFGPEYVLDPPVTEAAEGAVTTPLSPRFTWIDDSIANLRTWAAKVRLSDPIPARDKAIRDLGKAIEVDGGSKSSVIMVELESKSPTAAREMLAAYIDAYRQLHVRVNRTPENFDFFDQQTKKLEVQLEEARQRLREAKDEQGIVEIVIRKQNLQEQVSEIDLNIRNVRARLAAADAALLASQKRLEQIPERLMTDEVKGIGDAATDTMRPELYRLEIEAERVKKLYAEGHPKRDEVLEQLAQSRAIYEQQSKERPTQTSTINQAWTEVQLKVIEEEAIKASVLAELDALQQQREELQDTLRKLNSAEIHIARLQEEVDLLQASHRQYAENLELSRIDEELRREEISNVSVVQEPSLILQPVSPNKRIVFLAGVMLALMNSVAFALFRDRHTIRARHLHEMVGGDETLEAPQRRTLGNVPVEASTDQQAVRPRSGRGGQQERSESSERVGDDDIVVAESGQREGTWSQADDSADRTTLPR